MVMTNSSSPPNIILNNLGVPLTREYKYQYDIVIIDSKLQPPIWKRKNATGTVPELLNMLSQTRQFSILAAIQYLDGIIIPKLLPYSEVKNQITEEDQHHLEQIQSQSIKRMLHLPCTAPPQEAFTAN